MMARVITKELAEKIVKKLQGRVESTSGAHDIIGVYHNGVLVATFGLRRGSSKDIGHDHISKELYVSTGFANRLAQCTKSREEWIEEMIRKGHIDAD